MPTVESMLSLIAMGMPCKGDRADGVFAEVPHLGNLLDGVMPLDSRTGGCTDGYGMGFGNGLARGHCDLRPLLFYSET